MRDLRRLPLLALCLALGVAFGVPSAFGQSIWDQQQSLDSKIAGLQSEISRAKNKEGVLTTEISSASSQISALEGDISSLTARVAALESDLAVHRARLEQLQDKYRQQTERYNLLRDDHQIALHRLEARLVELYETADTSERSAVFTIPRASSEPAHPVAPARHTRIVTSRPPKESSPWSRAEILDPLWSRQAITGSGLPP